MAGFLSRRPACERLSTRIVENTFLTARGRPHDEGVGVQEKRVCGTFPQVLCHKERPIDGLLSKKGRERTRGGSHLRVWREEEYPLMGRPLVGMAMQCIHVAA